MKISIIFIGLDLRKEVVEMRYSHSIVVNEIVNLTSSTISMYEESTGSIRKFEPVDISSVKFEILDSTKKQYVVDCRFQIFEIIAYGCDIENISILEKQEKGRSGETISYLVWARNPEFRVMLNKSSSLI